MPESVFMKLGMYIMAPEPISTAYFILIVARQRIGKNVTTETNTHGIIE
jgi:hypothetical protein